MEARNGIKTRRKIILNRLHLAADLFPLHAFWDSQGAINIGDRVAIQELIAEGAIEQVGDELQLAGQPVTDNIDVTAVLAATVALQASGGDEERAERRVKAALPPGAVRTAILEQLKGVDG